jgi:serine phosphatase RsbU (regulator of sigma subunit)
VLRAALAQAGLDSEAGGEGDADVAGVAVLLGSQLCENAILRAGTPVEFAVCITERDLTVTVSAHSPTAVEQYLPASVPERAVQPGRSLLLVDALASAWGTRHDSAGYHVWFRLNRRPSPPTNVKRDAEAASNGRPPTAGTAEPGEGSAPHLSVAQLARVLHMPPRLRRELSLAEELTELLGRFAELVPSRASAVLVDYGDGQGPDVLAEIGELEHPVPLTVDLPLTPPLRGQLSLAPRQPASDAPTELVALCAQRVALSVEADWLRGTDQRHRMWMSYLARASELLAQPRKPALTATIVPALVIPRLGAWCGVYLLAASGGLELAALGHVDEEQVEPLRAVLTSDDSPSAPLTALTSALQSGPGPTCLSCDAGELIAVELNARGRTQGVLAIGQPAQRARAPEETMIIADLAQRVGLAIDNARHLAEHKATSLALQRALLPPALPTAPWIDRAAQYLPASSTSSVGGDFYDVRELTPGGAWMACIGDVCGKGARAAARTGLIRDVLRVLVRDQRPLEQALARLNEVLMEADDPYLYTTLAVALVSPSRPTDRPGLDVNLALAGHERPVLLRANGTAELVGTDGTALGLLPTVRITPVRVHLGPGDALVGYTDGVVEQPRPIEGAGRERFGHARLLTTLRSVAGQPAARIVAQLREAVAAYGPEPQYDDIALLALRAPGQVDLIDEPASSR